MATAEAGESIRRAKKQASPLGVVSPRPLRAWGVGVAFELRYLERNLALRHGDKNLPFL